MSDDRPRWREVRDGEVLAGTPPVDVDGKQTVLDEDEDEEAGGAEAAQAAEATNGKDAAATAAAAALREAAAKLARMSEVDRLVWAKVERERLEVSDRAMKAAIKEALAAQQAEDEAGAQDDPEFATSDAPKETIEEAIQRLATLDGAAYMTALADAAKTFNVKPPSALDRLVRSKREQRPPPSGATGIMLPRGFRLDETGLWFQPLPSHQSPEPAPVFICGAFEVLGQARDLESRAWGIAIRWLDHDRRPHVWSCPQRQVHLDGNAIAAELADAGLSCGTSKQAHELLKQFLGALRTSDRLQSAERGGWHITLTNIGFVSPETTVITAQRNSP